MRTPPSPPEMTCGFLIQLVFTSGHQSVTPFLSGAPLLENILDKPLLWIPMKLDLRYLALGIQSSTLYAAAEPAVHAAVKN